MKKTYEAPKITNLTNICNFKIGAESQRETELKLYGHDEGCTSFKERGCYDCDGFKTEKDCSCYIPIVPKNIELYLEKRQFKPKPIDTRSPEEIMLKELLEKNKNSQ